VKCTFFAYTALLGGLLLTTLRRWRTADLVPVAVMGLWLALGLWHLRAVADMARLTGPLVAAALRSGWWQARRWPMLVGIGLLVGLVTLGFRPLWQVHDWRWNMQEPRCLAGAIERLGLYGRLYKDMDSPWLLFRLHPAVRIEATWEYVADPERWLELEAVWRNWEPGVLPRHLDRYQVDGVVLPNSRAWRVPELLAHGWVIVHVEDRVLIMLRRSRWRGPIYRYIRPACQGLAAGGLSCVAEALATPEEAPSVLEEADRMLRHCPEGAMMAHAYRAASLQHLGRYAEAAEAYRQLSETPGVRYIP